MTEQELPFCCQSGHWALRDPIKRAKELKRRGYSSLPKVAVCTTCGRTLFVDPGKPDEEFQKRKQMRRQRNKQQTNKINETKKK